MLSICNLGNQPVTVRFEPDHGLEVRPAEVLVENSRVVEVRLARRVAAGVLLLPFYVVSDKFHGFVKIMVDLVGDAGSPALSRASSVSLSKLTRSGSSRTALSMPKTLAEHRSELGALPDLRARLSNDKGRVCSLSRSHRRPEYSHKLTAEELALIAVSAKAIDFGRVIIGSLAKKVFKLKNGNPWPVTFRMVASEQTVTTGCHDPVVIPANREVECDLSWNPSAPGPLSSVLTYLLNEQNTLSLSITGQADSIAV